MGSIGDQFLKRRGVHLFDDPEYGAINRREAAERGMTEEEYCRFCEDEAGVDPRDRITFPLALDDAIHKARFGDQGARGAIRKRYPIDS